MTSDDRGERRSVPGDRRGGASGQPPDHPARPRSPRPSTRAGGRTFGPTSSQPRAGSDTDRHGGGPDRKTLSRSTLWDDDTGDGRPRTDAGSPVRPQTLRARWEPVPPRPSAPPVRRRRAGRRRSGFGWFVHNYGWRAYAIPVLVAITVVVIVGMVGASRPGRADAAGTGGSGAVTVTVRTAVPTTVTMQPSARSDAAPPATAGSDSNAQTTALDAAHTGTVVPTPAPDTSGAYKGVALGVLPAGRPFAQTGAGTFHIVPGTPETFGDGPDHQTFTIEVENGIETPAADQVFAQDVMRILSSKRSWVGGGEYTLSRVTSGNPDFRVTLTSQMTVRRSDACGWSVPLEASCYNRLAQRVFINDARWIRGAASYEGDLASYRVYAINHEVGHALGHHHEPCPSNGGLAPVMMQQSWSTADDDLARLNKGGPVQADGKVCRYNPFVHPDAPAGQVPTRP